jgi:hypothetical protein
VATQIKFVDNSGQVKLQMTGNTQRALMAIGIRSVALIGKQMQSGYTDPHPTRDSQGRETGGTHTDIRFTGDLMRDVNFDVEASAPDTVDVGNSLFYAPFVHEGTYKLRSRPYIKDAIQQGKAELQRVAEIALSEGYTDTTGS